MNIFEVLLNHPLIPLFIVANLAIGWWANRKATTGSFEDYALASRNLPTGVLVMTLLATFVGAWEVEHADSIFRSGMLHGVNQISHLVAFFFVGTFVAPCLVYFTESTTLPDVFGKMYGKASQVIAASIGLMIGLLMMSLQVEMIGYLGKELLDIDSHKAVLIFGLMVVLYSSLGGIRAVSYTDVVQIVGVFMVFGWIAQKVLAEVGGISFMLKELKANHTEKLQFFSNKNFYHQVKSASFWSLSCTYIFTLPISQRMLMTGDKKKVRHMWYTSALFYGLLCALITLIGLAIWVGKEKFGVTEGSRHVLLSLIKNLWKNNDTVKTVFFIGILGIMLSTIDSYLHAMGITLIQDVVVPIGEFWGIKPLSSEKKTMYARLSVLLIGIFVVASIYLKGSWGIGYSVYEYTVLLSVGVTIPLIIGILGIKTDLFSFLSFYLVYFITMFFLSLQKWSVTNYFLVAVPLAKAAYFITHIYINKGIATLTRSKLTISERLWLPRLSGIKKCLTSWFTTPLRLPTVADRKVITSPTQPLAFSLVMIFLFMISSVISTQGSDEQLYMMVAVRGIGIALCVGLMLEGIWSKFLKPYFPMYWFCTLWYCLPFAGSLAFLQNHATSLDLGQWIVMFVILAALVDSSTFMTLSITGVGLSLGGWYLFYGKIPSEGYNIMPFYIFVGIVLSILLFSRTKEAHNKKRLEWNRIAAGMLAHDLQSTVQMLDGSGHTLENAFKEGGEMNNKEGKEGYHLLKGRALFLKNFSQHMVEKAYFARRDIAGFLDFMKSQILGKFEQAEMSMEQAAKEATHKVSTQISKKVKIICPQDFTAKTLTGVFPNVISNLLKNASSHGNAQAIEITINAKKRTLTIHDDGKGIPSDVLPRIFDLHYSTEKGKENSGTGLAFVQMVMEASGGKVSCYSKHGTKGSFTQFVLDFSKR
ncbi:MAG: ATP-binding protein [Bacteroidota bacterium]